MSLASEFDVKEAAIIIIGDEVLLGETLDSNSGEICRQLLGIGIKVGQISTVADDTVQIHTALQNALKSYDLVITSGGLGPTLDDKTRDSMALLLNQELVEHAEALDWIRTYYEKVAQRKMNDLNRRQAFVPKNSIPLKNEMGTAPAIWSEVEDKIIINLPGVPWELQHMLENSIIPKLRKKIGTGFYRFQYLYTENIPESELATTLQNFETQLPEGFSLAYLPSRKKVKLRLSGLGSEADQLKEVLDKQLEEIIRLIPSASIIPYKNWEEKIGDLYQQNSFTISTAESFTSGRVANLITSVSGSSMYLKAAIVAYDENIKKRFLDIPASLIAEKGVVNEEVATKMAQGAKKIFQTDFSVATTGVAGEEKDAHGSQPKTAYIVIATPKEKFVHFFEKPHLTRQEFTEVLAKKAVELLYHSIQDYFEK